MLSLRTLGELRLDGAGGEPLAGRRKELVLLAYLARRSPRPVRRAELIGLFWADRDEALARQSLRQAVLRLRRAVGEGLSANAETVQLAEGAVELDVTAFQADLTAGRPCDALERWGGEFLPETEDVGGETFRMWLDAERVGMRRRLAIAFEQLLDTESGRAAAEPRVHLLPLDERVHRRWVEALHRDGHTEDALFRHAAFVARLRRELGVNPSEEFLRLGSELERAAAPKSSTGSPGSIALFTPDLVGRDAALAELRAAWSAAARGEAAVVVVEGGEGMGKTLLCEEFLRDLNSGRDSPFVLHARGSVEDPASSWQSARELFAGIANAPGLGGVPDRALAEVSRLVPAIRARFPRLPEPTTDDRMLSGAFQQVLGTVAQEVPIAVFLDDLPYFDAQSAELGLWLAAHSPPGVLMLLTARPEWLHSRGTLASLCRASGVRRIKLTPLGKTEIEALLRSMLELKPDERPLLAARLHDETGGNPYHVSEIVSTMVDEGSLVLDARGFWRAPSGLAADPLPVPIGVRDAAVRRFAVLNEPAQLVLRAAAQLPEPFEMAAARESVGLAPSEFEAALDELIARRLLRPVSSEGGPLEFVSPLMRRFARDRHTGSRESTAVAMRGRRTRRTALLVLAALTPLAAAIAVVLSSQAASAPPVIAVGQLAAHGAPDIAAGAAATADMLATNLAQVPGLQVVSSARMHEVVAQLGSSAASGAAWAGAARQAGATELIEGGLHAREGGGIRLDLRRVDLRTGAVRAAYTVEGSDPFELVDRATAELAADLNLRSRSPRLADVTTPSFVAYRFYEEGLRSYAVADYRGAMRLFDAALAEDSLFGMAAHYAGLSHVRLSLRIPQALHERLQNVGTRVTDRERLLMRGTWDTTTGGSQQLAVAETLAIRYPTEPDGHYLLAEARMSAGDFLGALPHLERVIAMDSLGLRGTHARCLACDALARTITAYTRADSLAGAERVARDWVGRQPRSALAWFNLAMTLEATDRYENALTARRNAASLNPIDKYDALFPAMVRIRAGDYAAADRLLRELAGSTTPEIQKDARWFLTISLRNQGRLREALEIVGAAAPGGADEFRQHQAQVLLELGRTREAAFIFDTIAVVAIDPRSPAVLARHRTWNLTHRSAALAAADDTARLGALADTIEAWGARSRYGRDWRLHHHVRGLLAAARARPEEAAAQFRKAMYSPTSGYTRTNLELARVLLDLGRPREAVSALQPAFRGPLEASNLYVTRTELHEMLGRAWEAAGQTDSAVVHYQRVLRAWRNADFEFHARRDAVRIRLRGLGRSESSALGHKRFLRAEGGRLSAAALVRPSTMLIPATRSPLAYDQADHIAVIRTKGNAHPDLTGPLAD